MTVRVLIERWTSPGYGDTVVEMIRRGRSEALRQRGYMYGETWRDQDHPQCIMVLSVWATRAHWDTWEGSDFRRNLDQHMLSMLSGPPTIRVFEDLPTPP